MRLTIDNIYLEIRMRKIGNELVGTIHRYGFGRIWHEYADSTNYDRLL